ncbi:MAG: hypothetical protein E6G31_06760 [Actinobacteria bacterium]|nr:MAG: hypothetical protein E6G31_06760 [Actinomycetota bacterium]
MEPSEPYPPDRPARPEPGRDPLLLLPGGIWAMGERIAVIGWHTGVIGKLVFLLGLAVVVLVVLHELGIDLPATVPESLVIIVLGSLSTILVLVRVISVPDQFFPYDGRGIGLWIALIAAVGLIVGGLLRAGEEL